MSLNEGKGIQIIQVQFTILSFGNRQFLHFYLSLWKYKNHLICEDKKGKWNEECTHK